MKKTALLFLFCIPTIATPFEDFLKDYDQKGYNVVRDLFRNLPHHNQRYLGKRREMLQLLISLRPQVVHQAIEWNDIPMLEYAVTFPGIELQNLVYETRSALELAQYLHCEPRLINALTSAKRL
ncbi:MAG: hypothetical protein V4534_08010 [Myxococcota bacterium]